MSVPRFVPVSGVSRAGVSSPAWPGAGAAGGVTVPSGPWVAWRLLGANNRELGRSWPVYASAPFAAAAARSLQATLAEARSSLSIDLGDGLWGWSLVVGGERLAISGRRYSRQRECRYSLAQFLALAPSAVTDFAPGRWQVAGYDRTGDSGSVDSSLSGDLARQRVR